MCCHLAAADTKNTGERAWPALSASLGEGRSEGAFRSSLDPFLPLCFLKLCYSFVRSCV